MRLPLALVLVLASAPVVATFAACAAEGPSDGFEKFFAALADNDPAAFDLLSTKAQADFAAAARAKGLEPAAFLTSAVPRSTVKSLDVVENNGERAVVEVKDVLGNKERVQMVKEGGRWRVDLSR